MLTMHDNKPYFIESMTVPDYIYDNSMNCLLKSFDISDNTYHQLPRYTPEYSELYDVVMGDAPRDVLIKFTKQGKYVGPNCDERMLIKITSLNTSLPLADKMIGKSVLTILNYIMKVFEILNSFHVNKVNHGNPLLQYMMIDDSDNIGLVNYTFMLKCTKNIKLSYGHKLIYYLWDKNIWVIPDFLYFLDFLIFVCSLHSFILIHPEILQQNLTNSHYVTLLAIRHVINEKEMFRSDMTLRIDLQHIKSMFMSPSYTNDVIINRELQRISLIFIEMEKINTIEETVYWLSMDVYTNFRHYFKIFDKTYNGAMLLNNEIKIKNLLKSEMSCFNLFTDLSSNETYKYMYLGKYLPNYIFMNRAVINKEIMIKINDLILTFRNNNFYHGSLTRRDLLIDISNNDIQVINLSYSKILHEKEEFIGTIDIHTGSPDAFQIDKQFLFFVDVFRLIATMYMTIDEEMIDSLHDNIVLSYKLIKENVSVCFDHCEPSIYDLSVKRISQILNDIDIESMIDYQNELKELSI
jgi:hypothetical protein